MKLLTGSRAKNVVVSLILLIAMVFTLPMTQIGALGGDGLSVGAGVSGFPDGVSANFDAWTMTGSKSGSQATIKLVADGFGTGSTYSQVIDGEIELPDIFDVSSVSINASGGSMSHFVTPRAANDRGYSTSDAQWSWIGGQPLATHEGYWDRSVWNAYGQWDWINTSSTQYTGQWLDGGIQTKNVLRFAYISKDNTDITLHGGQLSINIELTLNQDISDTKIVRPQLLRFGMYNDYTQTDRYDLPTTQRQDLLISKENSDLLDYSIRELYQGDDTDLIPSNKTAYAFEFYGLEKTNKMVFDGQELVYSPELSIMRGKPNYILMHDSNSMGSVYDPSQLVIYTTATQNTQYFGDTDKNSVINAQDTLNTLSTWLRRLPAPNDGQIIAMNVTGDSTIDNRDTLTIMQMYTTGIKAPVSYK